MAEARAGGGKSWLASMRSEKTAGEREANVASLSALARGHRVCKHRYLSMSSSKKKKEVIYRQHHISHTYHFPRASKIKAARGAGSANQAIIHEQAGYGINEISAYHIFSGKKQNKNLNF